MTPYRTFVLALMLGVSFPTGTYAAVPAAEAADAALAALIAAPRLDAAAVGRLYDRTLPSGEVGALHARLDAMARAEAQGDRRARILLLNAALFWREGDRTDALAATDAAITASPGTDAYMVRGELTEITDAGAAANWYRKARDSSTVAAERLRLGLRIALIAGLANPDALVAFAKSQPEASRGGMATVVALLGKPAAALALDPAGNSGGLTGALRDAEWAAAAADGESTRRAAWRAYTLAKDPRDRNYALALLVEGFRAAGDMTAADAFLASKPQTADIEAARADILLEAGRNADAIALVRGSRDPALRDRLIGILNLAGDRAGGVAEYRRRIATTPQAIDAYVGLAAMYLGRGEEAEAKAVFRELFAANRGRTEVLTAAGRQMVAMGLGDDAIAMMRTDGSTAAGNVTQLFLFRSYLDQGKTAEAEAALAALAANAPSAAVMAEIADGYDLLQQPDKALNMLHRLEARGALDYDRSVQAAQLAASAGQTEEALRRWMAVRQAATLPARRSYAEKRITALANDAGRIDALARDSEARLAAGTAQPDEIDFLVSLRLAQGDRTGALSAVRRYAGATKQGEVAALRQQAQIFARLKDYDALQVTLRRLVTADPAHRDDYLRQLTLTAVRYGEGTGDAKRAELERLMASFDDAAPEFRGAVYALAGLGGAALDQYRSALAADPGSGDALTRFADALRKQGRGSEAATVLQFAVETAGSDDAAAAGLDGMLDLADPGSGGRDQIGPARLAALQWVERRALERIAKSGADARLSGILVDLAEMSGDAALEVRTYESSLPGAGGQRPYALRQLLMLTGPVDGGEGAAAVTLDEPQRRLRYMRRLLALRQPYPPEFYGSVAVAMLKAGDRAGAERAFALMSNGGLVNVDEVRGRAYAAAGLKDAALAAMGLALARDQDNLNLLVDTSILREQNGEPALAFRWYWRGLTRVIARQAEGARNAADQAFDIDKFGATLTEGALLNWRAAGPQGDAAIVALQGMFDTAVAPIDTKAPGTLLDHARLASIVDLGRRVRSAQLDSGRLADWDAALAPLFGKDIAYQRQSALFRDLEGVRGAAVPGWSDRGAAMLFVQARDSGNAALAMALAIRAGDMDMARTTLEDQFRSDQAWQVAAEKKQAIGGMPPDLSQLIGQAVRGLSPEQIRAVVVPVVTGMANGEAALFDLYRAQPELYARLGAAMGRAPIAEARLLDLLNTRANDRIGWSAAVGAYWGGDWMPGDFTTEQQLDLYDRLTTRMEGGAVPSPLATGVLRTLLAHPLSPAQAIRLAAILHRDVAYIRDPRERSIAPVLPHLLLPDTLLANRALLMAAVEQANGTYPDAAELAPFLTAWFTGDAAGAMQHLQALESGLAATPQLENAIDIFRNRQAAQDRQRKIDAVMKAVKPTPEQMTALYNDVIMGAAGNLPQRQVLDYSRRLIALDPDRAAYRTAPLDFYRQNGDGELLVGLLRPYVDQHKGDTRAAAALALAYRLIGDRAEADSVIARSQLKLDDPAWMQVQMAADGGAGVDFAALLGGVFERYSAAYPDDPAVQAVLHARGQTGDASAPLVTLLLPMLTAQKRAPGDVPGIVRGWWRNNVGDEAARMGVMGVVATRIAAGDRVLASIFARADVMAELSAELDALSPDDRHTAQPVYDIVARGLVASGEAPARLDELSARLRAGEITANDLQLLATLADVASSPLDGATTQALLDRLPHSPAMGVRERVRLAGVLGRSGQVELAIDLMVAALDQASYPLTTLDRDAGAGTVVAALRSWSDRPVARRAYDALVQRARQITLADPDSTLEIPPFEVIATPIAQEADG
ncbi:tetratricopeptide repeat protein [Sphingomonas sp. CLY1604]|uniref:tetratricopeptide repeat protein n=1 Tax=Sphingomonas sp. CLY1604 TaxID=3457786 RepID=UPI003FD8151A